VLKTDKGYTEANAFSRVSTENALASSQISEFDDADSESIHYLGKMMQKDLALILINKSSSLINEKCSLWQK